MVISAYSTVKNLQPHTGYGEVSKLVKILDLDEKPQSYKQTKFSLRNKSRWKQ